MNTPSYGQLILFSRKNWNFLSSSVKFFTRSPYSHVAVMFPPILGVESYFGAEERVDMNSYPKLKEEKEHYFRVYAPIGFDQEQIDNVLRKLYVTYAGSIYGFFQLFWFIYRWFMESFKVRVNSQHNWFPDSQICSEIAWWWFEYLCDEQPERMAGVRTKLHDWNSNTFAPVDCLTMIHQLPEIFELTEEYWYGQ